MSDNKKYYYLKLKDNFFETEEMIILENMPDGYLYSNILLKLYLRSLKDEGKLMFKDRIPYNPVVLAQITRHQVGTVEKALNVFRDLGLIEVLDNGAIFMLDIQNYIGQSSNEADRKREYRQRITDEKHLLLSDGGVDKCPDKSPPEKEIELEIEKEIDIIPYKEIIDYLNLKTDSKYKHSTNKTKDLIKARFNEKFTLEDFKAVIDIKTEQWLSDKNMAQYLRPETLFGTKFESYLNSKGGKTNGSATTGNGTYKGIDTSKFLAKPVIDVDDSGLM